MQFSNIHLLATENETLLSRWNALLFLDTLLDALHLIIGLDVNLNLQKIF